MEGFVYSPYRVYQGYGGTFTPSHSGSSGDPKQQQQPPNWKQSKSSSGPSPYLVVPSPAAAPEPADYLDSYKRAQLKALLSQVSPGLTPRLRKANTKEVGVQVNPRVDASVQCSLGPRKLQPGRLQSPSGRFSQAAPAVYSPVLDRRLFTLPEAARPKAEQEAPAAAPEGQDGADGEQAALHPEEPGERSRGPDAAQQPQRDETEEAQREEGAAEAKRSAFQFLEQKYGYFHCKDCKTRWESAYVWCISGSNKVYFKQLCRKCQKGFNPYRVEAIQCQTCAKTRCSCPQKKRHIDLKRPHRQELCGRCKGKRLSCDNTYSFKYIV
ncbi:protein ZAR1-like [Emydura macquarii macquarii]|uniref:protein ZAR1-like n=1 Tax=Emydura macquarii macquarii TaxID=1129001 RepID=UPI00352B6255